MGTHPAPAGQPAFRVSEGHRIGSAFNPREADGHGPI